jgi:hypothetical protein
MHSKNGRLHGCDISAFVCGIGIGSKSKYPVPPSMCDDACISVGQWIITPFQIDNDGEVSVYDDGSGYKNNNYNTTTDILQIQKKMVQIPNSTFLNYRSSETSSSSTLNSNELILTLILSSIISSFY